jgi:hypothetical protein
MGWPAMKPLSKFATNGKPLLEGPWLEAEVRGLIAQVCELTGHWDLALSHYLKAFSLGREVGAKTH